MPAEPKKRTKQPPEPAWPEQTEASQAQKKAAAQARERKSTRRPPLPVATRRTEAGEFQLGSAVTDERLFQDLLLDACGTRSSAWADRTVSDLANLRGGKTDPQANETLSYGLAFLHGLAPRDEVEAALGAQMLAIHTATMTLARRTASAEMRDQYRDYGNLLVKTTRTFAAQVEALAKLRSGGKQQVEVRYVYVDARGGQNIIGSQIGGRSDPGNQQQPHVPGLAFAPGAPVWGPDPAGFGVPAAGDEGQEAMPSPWREEPGGAHRTSERELPARGADEQVAVSPARDTRGAEGG